ncbi:PucR family transcriptional regulator [Sinosporangium siamense]|uniref:PucR family transcriptional regulator n=1 Tax=Sinosporangium siamense TaxID=1367973 RepID=A0A919RIX4_9ACTN|nr:PucR family transcriptional regulator [Sinosporangium siamense]GII92831.1 PucR family transcriptional regulator [Sinosporangium siamense]
MLETVGDVAQRFRLRVPTGEAGLTRPIRWTHLSELIDPTPWLRGGELLLTLGLQLHDAEDFAAYAVRLAQAHIAALGFGIGTHHPSVPPQLVAEATRHGLAVLEIPQGVAFQDITYQLNADLLRTGAAESRLIAEGVSAMTQVARSAGTQGIVATLAHRIESWAVLMDPHGTIHAAVGAARVHVDDARAAALGQRSRIRHPGLTVYGVGDPVRPRAHLVVAPRPDRISLTRELAQHATLLLDLALNPLSGGNTWGLARADAVDALMSGDSTLIERVSARWNLVAGDVTVALLRSRSRAVPLEENVLAWCAELDLPPLVSEESSLVTALVPVDEVPRWRERVTRAVEREGVPARCGLGTAQPLAASALSRQQAAQALAVAVADAKPVVDFAGLATGRLILQHLDPAARTALTTPLLPLLAGDTTRVLLRSLRVFLSENTNWEAASSQLGIHRHTLRQRMARVEELTGLSISTTEDRVIAWLALQALHADHPLDPG